MNPIQSVYKLKWIQFDYSVLSEIHFAIHRSHSTQFEMEPLSSTCTLVPHAKPSLASDESTTTTSIPAADNFPTTGRSRQRRRSLRHDPHAAFTNMPANHVSVLTATTLLFLLLRLCAAMPGSSNNFKISPKPCVGNSYAGTCMFVWECIKSEGQHVGMCMDSFMFGSCCAHNLTDNIVMPQHIDYRPTKLPASWLMPVHQPYRPSPAMTSHLSSRYNRTNAYSFIQKDCIASYECVFAHHSLIRRVCVWLSSYCSGTTTIHRPHGAGTIVIRPSVTHRPYAHNRPPQPLPSLLSSPSSSPSSSPPAKQHQHHQLYHHQQPLLVAPAALPPPPQPVIESLMLGSREPPTGISSALLDNTIAASPDLDMSASISTGMYSHRFNCLILPKIVFCDMTMMNHTKALGTNRHPPATGT